jgi:ornithine decarboxylase
MKKALASYQNVADMLRTNKPRRPVYCIYPELYRETAAEFVNSFAGRVLYAVKANDHPEVIRLLVEGGVRHFDCASLAEIEAVKRISPEAACYFMTPVRLRGAAREAQSQYGVRHFMIDHQSGLDSLVAEIDLENSVVFARMAVHHPSAMQDLSIRFGAPQEDIPGLLTRIAESGAEAALAFNVGSNVTDPAAYRYAIGVAEEVLSDLPFKVRLVDIGGGFPKSYPGYAVPSLTEYLDAVQGATSALPLQEDGEILTEPGRALAAPGLSAVVEVLLRKERRLFLNDGMYGIFWELRFKGHDRFPSATVLNWAVKKKRSACSAQPVIQQILCRARSSYPLISGQVTILNLAGLVPTVSPDGPTSTASIATTLSLLMVIRRRWHKSPMSVVCRQRSTPDRNSSQTRDTISLIAGTSVMSSTPMPA